MFNEHLSHYKKDLTKLKNHIIIFFLLMWHVKGNDYKREKKMKLTLKWIWKTKILSNIHYLKKRNVKNMTDWQLSNKLYKYNIFLNSIILCIY